MAEPKTTYSAEIKAKSLALHSLGFPHRAISEELDIPLNTLKPWFKGKPKGSIAELTESVKKEISKSLGKELGQRVTATTQVNFDLASRTQNSLYKVLDEIERVPIGSVEDVGKLARATAAVATSVKSLSDMMRTTSESFGLGIKDEKPEDFIVGLMEEYNMELLEQVVAIDQRHAKEGEVPPSRSLIEKSKADEEREFFGGADI